MSSTFSGESRECTLPWVWRSCSPYRILRNMPPIAAGLRRPARDRSVEGTNSVATYGLPPTLPLATIRVRYRLAIMHPAISLSLHRLMISRRHCGARHTFISFSMYWRPSRSTVLNLLSVALWPSTRSTLYFPSIQSWMRKSHFITSAMS